MPPLPLARHQIAARFCLMFLGTRAMNVSTANHLRQRRNMATFTIDSENNFTVLAGLPAGADDSQSFSNAKEMAKLTAEWPVSRLADTWNSFAGVAPFDDPEASEEVHQPQGRDRPHLGGGLASFRG